MTVAHPFSCIGSWQRRSALQRTGRRSALRSSFLKAMALTIINSRDVLMRCRMGPQLQLDSYARVYASTPTTESQLERTWQGVFICHIDSWE